jgi:SulP family sulfate permease
MSDLVAGAVVGTVALPLSMALAIASGVPPQHGLYTAIVAGALIAVLGGSAVQVSGPTAAFVVLLAPVTARFGISGLLIASALAGVVLVGLGLARLGRLIEFVPYPVVTGFTAGIAVVIAVLQLRDFLGLTLPAASDHALPRLVQTARALPTTRIGDLAIGSVTLAVLLAWPRFGKLGVRVPAPLVALGLATLAGWSLASARPELAPATIGTRFEYQMDGRKGAGIPRGAPTFLVPWHQPGPSSTDAAVSWKTIGDLMPAALAIALLGAIESLLSAVIADGMTGQRHDPDAELVAQGVGNIVAPFFGGFAATGAIARTATSIRAGARSPVAAVAHAGFVLLAAVALAPALSLLPMAALAALLLLVAWNMSDLRHVARMIRTGIRGDVALLALCFSLTVVFDMVVAVSTGVVVGSLLFLRNMAEASGTERVVADPLRGGTLPADVVVYRVAGPLFFGAAQKAMEAVRRWEKDVRLVIMDLSEVPVIDATGLVHLETAAERLIREQVHFVVIGPRRALLRVLLRAGWRRRPGVSIQPDVESALRWFRGRTGAGSEDAT